jgi:VCBS repeat-containing protein
MELMALCKPIKKPPRSDERDGELFCGTDSKFRTLHIDGNGTWAICGYDAENDVLKLQIGGSLAIDDNFTIQQVGYYGTYDQRVTANVNGTFYYSNNNGSSYSSRYMTAGQQFQYGTSWAGAGATWCGYFVAS